MWKSLALLPVLLAPSLAQILQFGSGQLPLCAQTCTQLANAQAPCLSQPSTEQTCFCQSTILTQQTNLAQSSDNICNSVCPAASDRQQIQGWFNNYCHNAQQNPSDPNSSPTSSAPASPTSDAAAATSSSFEGTPVDDNSDWWSSHAKWVAMVIVLIVGFALIIVAGVWLKRRHDRKVNRATMTPVPVGWGPNADPHHYPDQNGEKGARDAASATVSVMEEGRSKSHRLSKIRK
ncbi:MAG: hypothetical protein Q9159_001240 [Coniocarpon cinnabarinum]